jgi:hypothetical protein
MTELLEVMIADMAERREERKEQNERAEKQFKADERRHTEQIEATQQANKRDVKLERAGKLLKGVLFKMP